MGPPRHLALLPETTAECLEWPVPFADGLPILQSLRGQRVVVLASGDPFWFGAGAAIARTFRPDEWRALPGPSTFSLAAARLGWSLEDTHCLGLHAQPLAQMRRHLAIGVRMIVLVRDGPAVSALADYLTQQGFGDSLLHVLERLGGPAERQTDAPAHSLAGPFTHPVCVAVTVDGSGIALPQIGGLPDDTFENDGQITKRPIRAMTLSTLAPKPGEHLWDIGAGSGSIALEWLLAHPSTQATAVEIRADRVQRISRNAEMLGVANRLNVVEGNALEVLDGAQNPDAVFVGGGLSDQLLEALSNRTGTRLIVNAVTLEGETLLSDWHTRLGGTLMRIDLATASTLGSKRAWRASYPLVQWSVTL